MTLSVATSITPVLLPQIAAGYRCVDIPTDKASDSEVWIAAQIGALLALPNGPADQMSRETMQKGLKALVDGRFKGQMVPPCVSVGLARGTLATWLNGSLKPSLPALLKICMLANCDLGALLKGRLEAPAGRLYEGQVAGIGKRTYRRVAMTDQEIRESLRRAAASDSPPSIKAHCDCFGLRHDVTTRRFPIEAAALKKAREVFLRMQSKLSGTETEAKLEAAALLLKEKGRPVRCRTLEEVAGVVTWSHHPAMKAVLARHGVAQ